MNFKNRLNSAFQAIGNVIKTVFSRFFTFCKTKPVEVISVVGVIASLYYSQKSLDKTVDAINQSDTQFQDNNKSQEEQDKRSREQHDSLMSVLKQQKTLLDLQLVSLKQQNEIVTRNLGVSKTQLKLAEEIQRREIEGGRCLFTSIRNEISDTSLKINNLVRPIIISYLDNIGKRPCINYKTINVAISKNWNLLSKPKYSQGVSPVNNGESLSLKLITSIDDIHDFYYFVKIVYSDEITGKEYKTAHYYHCRNFRQDYGFGEATDEEKEKILQVLKDNKLE